MKSSNAMILAALGLATSGCLLVKPHTAEPAPRPEPTAAEHEAQIRAHQLDHIGSLAPSKNPVVNGAAGNDKGAVIRPSFDSFDGHYGQALMELRLAHFAKDTLCVTVHNHYVGESDKPTKLDADIFTHYHLYAADALTTYWSDAPTMVGASARVIDFDATPLGSEYQDVGNGRVVKHDNVGIDEHFEICFDKVSQVLTPAAQYAVVDFVNDDGKSKFTYAWKF